MTTWQVQTAKQRFSELVRAAQSGEPQFITRHGDPVAVLVDITSYRRSHDERRPLVDFLVAGPDLSDLELPSREPEPDSTARLFGDLR